MKETEKLTEAIVEMEEDQAMALTRELLESGTAPMAIFEAYQEAMVEVGRRFEKGVYFIPELIDQWRSEKKFADFLNYEKIESYKDFSGVRIEDDVAITKDGHQILGNPIPKTIEEVETIRGGQPS